MRLFSENHERDYFLEAALLNVSVEDSSQLLCEVLHQSNIERERDVIARIKDQMTPSLNSGYFSLNEVENILYIAQQNSLSKDKILRLISDECLRTGCVNAREVADRFRMFLEMSYPPQTLFQDLSPFLAWAQRNQLNRRDARSILREHCAPHPLPYSYQ